MTLTEILFRVLGRLAPMLWYAHRLGYFLRVAVRMIDDEASLQWLADWPDERASTEAMAADMEHVLDIVIGLRTRELLGLAMPIGRPGLRSFARIPAAPSLERLILRMARLIARAQDAERLARRRAARLRRERAAAPVLLSPDHRPVHAAPAVAAALLFRAPTRVLTSTATPRIRAPPRLAPNLETQAHPNPPTPSARPRPHARKNHERRRVHAAERNAPSRNAPRTAPSRRASERGAFRSAACTLRSGAFERAKGKLLPTRYSLLTARAASPYRFAISLNTTRSP